MSQPLQPFDDDAYERPNQPWSCGHADQACPLGPATGGLCRAGDGCTPIINGNRAHCGRTPLQGGKCEEGPDADGRCGHPIPTCAPRASVRQQRGRFVLLCVAATFAAILVVLSAPWRNEFLAPGPLTRPHAQLLAPQNEQRCVACHGAAESHLGGWTLSLLSPGSLGGSQTDRCLKCHDKRIAVQTATNPHGLPTAVLERVTQRHCEQTGQPRHGTTVASSRDQGGPAMACAACHREHQGASHDLTTMTNSQCSNCHQQPFASLAEHPPFRHWPYQRRMRIAFDHASHLAKHFPQHSTEFACNACHLGRTATEVVSVSGYETCSGCHDEKIKQSFGDGLTLLALPLVDTRALENNQVDIGQWPAAARGDFDGSLPPLTRTLLASDAFAKSALEQFGDDFDFLDVHPDNVDDLEAVGDLLWGIKYLIHDLIQSSSAAWQSRLSVALDSPIDATLCQQLAGELPREAVRELQRAWFPNLMVEVAAHRGGRDLPPQTRSPEGGDDHANEVNGWRRDDRAFTFSYRPAGHASPFVRAWIDLLVASEPSALGTDAQSLRDQIISRTSMGLCTSCHSVDTGPTQPSPSLVNWRAHQDDGRHRFTRFAHDPHIILPELSDCTACHEVDAQADIMQSYRAGSPPTVFARNFLPLTEATCMRCHQPKAAGDNCTTCHNYHVE